MPSLLNVAYSELPAERLLEDPRALAVVRFGGAGMEPAADSDPRLVTTPLRPVDRQVHEVWSATSALRYGREGALAFARNDDLLMAHLTVPDNGADMGDLAYDAYTRVLSWLARQPGFHLWRCWNIFADINAGDGDDERYRHFSMGRFAALDEAGQADATLFPAATAIGSAGGPLFLMILAGREPARWLENPRQVSAWNYPRRYGPRSPSFARAAQLPGTDGPVLVSGTASVVGHETRHPGDWRAQLAETRTNLAALINSVRPEARPMALRLYVRAGLPGAEVAAALRESAGNVPLVVLEGDICRDDLLLEIEGVWA